MNRIAQFDKQTKAPMTGGQLALAKQLEAGDSRMSRDMLKIKEDVQSGDPMRMMMGMTGMIYMMDFIARVAIGNGVIDDMEPGSFPLDAYEHAAQAMQDNGGEFTSGECECGGVTYYFKERTERPDWLDNDQPCDPFGFGSLGMG
jgi:hypothetical protein